MRMRRRRRRTEEDIYVIMNDRVSIETAVFF
jgi:hypothetical protein